MKRAYKSPIVRKVEFQYSEQVNAASEEPWYCYVTIWKGPQALGICQNPEDWTGDILYLSPPTAKMMPF